MGHYFTNEENLKSDQKDIEMIINDKKYMLTTDNGVFSKRGLDFGTRCLLLNLPIDRLTGNVLDFGCGYGPIGIYIKDNTSATVDMVDINDRSLKLAKINAEKNKVSANIFKSDTYEKITLKYDFIISNPPIRVGKEKLYEILFEAKNHLKNKGELWIVINKNQGAKTVAKDLEREYKVTIVNKIKGFYIIQALKH